MSHNCPKKYGSADIERPAPTSAQTSILTETTKTDVDVLLENMKSQLTTDELKQKFFNGVIDQGFV